MKYLINYLSILAGRKFATAWHDDSTSRSCDGWKNVYIGLRQQLPVVTLKVPRESNHWGNHFGSGYKPWKASQGIK